MARFGNLNPYDLHKHLINDYLLKRAGDTALLQRDASKDRTDADVLRENHKFLWDDETAQTWEQQLAKKYYDKLFKEYCICDLSRYRENKVALRWRIEREVVDGKGQFCCGNKVCSEKIELRSWEVNFAYIEHGERKNALIKVRLCPDCSRKLNYHSKKREVKKLKKLSKKMGRKSKRKIPDDYSSREDDSEKPTTDFPAAQAGQNDSDSDDNDCASASDAKEPNGNVQQIEEKCWTKVQTIEEKSREEEFDEYLQDLLL